MSKLLHNFLVWCVVALVGSGLSLYFLLSYLNKFVQADPGYLDLMTSSIAAFVIIPFFIAAAYNVLRSTLADIPTYIQLALGEFTSKTNPRRPAKS